LLEVGFGYVCQKEDLLFFRKRKREYACQKVTGIKQKVAGMR